MELAVRGRFRYPDIEEETGKSPRETMEEAECQTCKERKYQDGSNDPGVSFKTPTKMCIRDRVQPVGKRVKPAHIDALDWDARLFRQSDNTRDRLAARRDIVTDVNAFHFTRTLEQLNDRVAAKHKPFLQIALRV